MTYVPREGPLRVEPPKTFQYTFAMGKYDKAHAQRSKLVPENRRPPKVTVTLTSGAEGRFNHMRPAHGWPRISFPAFEDAAAKPERHSSRIE